MAGRRETPKTDGERMAGEHYGLFVCLLEFNVSLSQ